MACTAVYKLSEYFMSDVFFPQKKKLICLWNESENNILGHKVHCRTQDVSSYSVKSLLSVGGLQALSSHMCDVTNHARRARLLKSDFEGSNEKKCFISSNACEIRVSDCTAEVRYSAGAVDCCLKCCDGRKQTLWYLDVNHGQGLFGSAVVSGHSVDRLRNVVQNQIQVHFIFLLEGSKNQRESHNNTNIQKGSICKIQQEQTVLATPPNSTYPIKYTDIYAHFSCTVAPHVCGRSFPDERSCFFHILTGDPLYRTLPQETHDHAS